MEMEKKIEKAISAIDQICEQSYEMRKRIDAIEGYSHLAERIALSCENYFLERTGFLEAESEHYQIIRELANIKMPIDYSLCHFGRKMDGGYVLLDDFEKADGRGICYSFGISDEFSFEEDLSHRGYDVYMYDHTISGVDSGNDRMHFFPMGIGREDNLCDGRVNTLQFYIERNNHIDRKNMILKIDVEGSEWNFLETVAEDVLDRFDQIVMELHGFGDMKTNFAQIETGLKKLNQTHQCVWIHCNNYGVSKMIDGVIITDAMEALFVNKREYSFSEANKEYYRNWPDYPNWFMRCDYDMSKWNIKPNKEDENSGQSQEKAIDLKSERINEEVEIEKYMSKLELLNERKDSIIAKHRKELNQCEERITELERKLNEAIQTISRLQNDNQDLSAIIEDYQDDYFIIPKIFK